MAALLALAPTALSCTSGPAEAPSSAARAARAPAAAGLRGQAALEAPAEVSLHARVSGSEALLQAVSPAADGSVWVSGHDGVWLRSDDGGASWRSGSVAGAETLQFRDVHALDARTAWLLSAGTDGASRIYRTDDGGASWRLQYRAESPDAFLDCFDFWDERRGVAFGDSIDGRFLLLRTEDGGDTWQTQRAGVPEALAQEGGFAASGTCVRTGADGRAWIATGNAGRARVLLSPDYGRSWVAVDTPARAGRAIGLTTLAFRDARVGMAAGGDIGAPDDTRQATVRTDDGGRTWSLEPDPLPGPVYAAAWWPAPTESPTGSGLRVAVGPAGVAVGGEVAGSWRRLSDEPHWAVALQPGPGPTLGWAVGPAGRITELVRGAPESLTAAELLERQRRGWPLLLIDVRTPEEYAGGHVPGAINVPHTQVQARLQEIRRAAAGREIVLYCRSGRRAGIAREILARAGFERLLHLQGDMLGWQRQGLPVEEPSG